jgi:hypothetical protein
MSGVEVIQEAGAVVVVAAPDDVAVVTLPEQGPQGPKGADGGTGAAGPIGPPGPTGGLGPRGYTGETGPAAWATPPVAWASGLVCVATAPATVVTYDGETFVCKTPHTAGGSFDAVKFTKVAAKATLDAHTHTLAQIVDAGTAAGKNVGTSAGNVVEVQTGGKLPALDGSQLTGFGMVPVGATIWVNGTSAPAGFIKENGAELSRATYAALWAYAQASGRVVTEAAWSAGDSGAFSSGNGSTTFRIPDGRGEFVRGLDDGRGVDASRALGSRQADAMQGHRHYRNTAGSAERPYIEGTGYTDALAGSNSVILANQIVTGSPVTDGANGTPRTAAETRPRNVSKLACIKY